MSEETNTPVEAPKAPKKNTTKPKAEPTIKEQRKALLAEREAAQERVEAISAELRALEMREREAKAAAPKKSDHDLWLEQKAISDARTAKQKTKKAEVQKVLSELGLA